MAVKVFFGDFRLVVNEHYKNLEAAETEAYSKHWFLLKYIRNVLKACIEPTEQWRVESSIKSLIRFYVDNIDEKSAQGEICQNIYSVYKKTLKEHQETKNK